jgi:uncharacterized protein involved in exopolysaccharide biosynthesis
MNETSKSTEIQTRTDTEQSDPGLLDILVTLSESIKIILLLPMLLGFASYIYSVFYIPPVFSAMTNFIPPAQNSSSASLVTGGSPAAMLIGNVLGGPAMPGRHIAYLNSDLLRARIIERFELTKKNPNQSITSLNNYLKGSVEILENKRTGLVEIHFTHEDPRFAADVVNAYVEELSKLLGLISADEARERREFLEIQLVEAMSKPYRNPALREVIISGLLRESELSRMAERQVAQKITQIDVAKPPEMRSGPKHTKRVVIAASTGLCLVVVAVIARFFLQNSIKNAETNKKLNRVRRAFGFRSKSNS